MCVFASCGARNAFHLMRCECCFSRGTFRPLPFGRIVSQIK